MAQVSARVTFSFNGKTIRTLPGATIKFGGVERTEVIDDQGGVHYSEKTASGGVEATVPHTADTNIEELRNAVDMTVVAELDTGKRYMMRGAFVTAPIELSVNENGEMGVNLSGQPFEEI